MKEVAAYADAGGALIDDGVVRLGNDAVVVE